MAGRAYDVCHGAGKLAAEGRDAVHEKHEDTLLSAIAGAITCSVLTPAVADPQSCRLLPAYVTTCTRVAHLRKNDGADSVTKTFSWPDHPCDGLRDDYAFTKHMSDVSLG